MSADLEGVLACIKPGEHISYSELLATMKARGISTAGVGVVLGAYAFDHYPRNASGEIVTWRTPYWDDEVEGGWAPGTLWIARRPARLTEGERAS